MRNGWYMVEDEDEDNGEYKVEQEMYDLMHPDDEKVQAKGLKLVLEERGLIKKGQKMLRDDMRKLMAPINLLIG